MNFSFFDQFPDIEIDLTDYLESLSTTSGTSYIMSNRQPVKTTIKNMFIKYQLDDKYKNDINLINRYEILEGELPDMVSYKNFNTVDFWWLILVFNNITDPLSEWPLSQEQLNTLSDLYFEEEGLYSRNTYYDMLFESNELKRYIILPRTQTLNDIIWAYQQKILER
ncbi:hypothetical protein GW796_05920 [archaeon]|nr:hypothetical protein [archaeon]NCQ51421.1 hypothetical protein [archaeon]NCT58753.1 hypothetical protein [archaeon]